MTTYYFDNNAGNDSWSGTLSVPNGGLTDGPWKSLSMLETGFNNASNSYLLESNSVWDLSSTNIAAAQFLTIYNTGTSRGLNAIDINNPSVISNYYASSVNNGKLPTITRRIPLPSNAVCKGMWIWDVTMNAWGVSLVNYSVAATLDGNDMDLTLGANVMPRAGCSCYFTTTGVLPTPLSNLTITGAVYAAGYVTYTTSAAHGWSPGQVVTIFDTSPGHFSGTFTIFDIPLTTTFRVPFAFNTGVYTSGGKIGYYAYPDTATGVKLYNNYTDALAGNGNFLVLSGGSGAHTIFISPLRGLATTANADLIQIGNTWGHSYSSAVSLPPPLPTGDGNYCGNLGTYKLYVYAPPATDPGAYYSQGVYYLNASDHIFLFWIAQGLVIKNLNFVNCVTGISHSVGAGTGIWPWTGRKIEVSNCTADMSAPLSYTQFSGAAGELATVLVHDNIITNAGRYGIHAYTTSGAGNVDNINNFLIYNNIIIGANQSFSSGGGIYIQVYATRLGSVVISKNNVSSVFTAQGSGYDGSGLYCEYGSKNILWMNNIVSNCPMALQDNSGDVAIWVGNVISGCTVGLNFGDAGGAIGPVNARDMTVYNNSFINMVPMSSFPANWYGFPNSTPPMTSMYATQLEIIHAYQNGLSVTFTVSTTTATIATRPNGNGSPGTGVPIVFSSTVTLPTPLVTGGIYYARKLSASTFSVHPTNLDALNNTNAISMSGGSGTHTGVITIKYTFSNNIITSKDPIFASSGFAFGMISLAFVGTTVSISNTIYNGISTLQAYAAGTLNNNQAIDPKINSNGTLQLGSPTIDAGTFVGYWQDASGRPFGNPPTIGAYEFYTPVQDPYTGP